MINLYYRTHAKHTTKKTYITIKLYLNNKIIKVFKNVVDFEAYKIIKTLEHKYNIKNVIDL